MKKIILISLILSTLTVELFSQTTGTLRTANAHMIKSGDYMAVIMDMQTDSLNVPYNRAVLMTPSIVKGDSLVVLNSVGVYSYNRWFYYKRNGEHMISGRDEASYRDTEIPALVPYEAVVPYSDWMDGAELILTVREYGCCNKVMNESSAALARYDGPYFPQLVYVSPVAEEHKYRQISGSAFIDFPVSETVIYPDYRNNTEELAKISATIDAVVKDSDITVKSMSIKGFASPESPYGNNAHLASGRTEALKTYVHNLYHLSNDIITTDFEPENWAGLRDYVEASDLTHKAEILAIIDSDREPDNKEWKIKSGYKDEYNYLLKNCYPSLRRSDYKIEYEIRSYTDTSEIAKLMYVKPQNLSLNEFYMYAQGLEKDSDEFVDVFEIAVRMFPDDQVANLNAANTAMARKDMRNAARYLAKAGDSPETEYARAVFEYLQGNQDKALQLFSNALERGVTEAEQPILKIIEMKELANKYK